MEPEPPAFTHASLFSGLGGFDLAARWMGWTNVFHCEKDPFCQRVLAHHFPESTPHGDINQTELVFYPAVFHASPFQPPENGSAPQTAATCGHLCLAQYAQFAPATWWARTFPASLVGMAGWSSGRCALSWRLKATKSSRLYFRLAVLVRPTAATGFGSPPAEPTAQPLLPSTMMLPTPLAVNREHTERVAALMTAGAPTMNSRMNGDLRPTGLLDALMFQGLLPTPTADCASDRSKRYAQGGMPLAYAAKLLPTPTASTGGAEPAGKTGRKLVTVVANALPPMLPTPATRDWKGANGQAHIDNGTGRKHLDQLPNALKFQDGMPGRLNPQFVREMMGFPVGWLESPFLNGETNP